MESGFLTRTNSESKELLTRISRPKSLQTVPSFRDQSSTPQIHEIAGSDGSQCAGQKGSRPVLRVVSTFNAAGMVQSGQEASPLNSACSPSTPTGRRVLSHAEVSQIWNSHVDSLYALMANGPQETRWIGGSPVIAQSGEQMVTRTTQEALTRIMSGGTALAFSDGVTIDEADVAYHLYNQGLVTLVDGEFEASDMDYKYGQEATFNSDSSLYAFGQVTDARASSLASAGAAPAQGYVFGMGGMDRDFAGLTPDQDHQFGLSTPSEPASSPPAEHNEFAETAMDIDSNPVQEYVFGQGGMDLDFGTLSNQMAERNRDYIVHMVMDTAPTQPATTTQPSETGIATQPSAGSQAQAQSSNHTVCQPTLPPTDPNATGRATRALANSGVSVVTRYPLSTSPRMATREVNRYLDRFHDDQWSSAPHPMQSGDVLEHRKKIVKREKIDFQPFSWDSTSQPRTEAARRAEGSDGDISPRTKSNKRKAPELSKE
ncbi:hypothetical protein Q7P36_008329 [Cladosporium allicinum]